MASGEQNITALPVKTNTGVANSDYFMGIDSAEGYQILIRDVAKYIMENYNGSTLAGQAQTPKAAIDALNSNMTWKDAGSATQLNEEVVFPATAKELYIELAIQNSSGYVYSFYIVLTASRYYFNGYYTSSTDNGSCAINITSNHSVKAVTVNYKGDAQTAINMVVKYR